MKKKLVLLALIFTIVSCIYWKKVKDIEIQDCPEAEIGNYNFTCEDVLGEMDCIYTISGGSLLKSIRIEHVSGVLLTENALVVNSWGLSDKNTALPKLTYIVGNEVKEVIKKQARGRCVFFQRAFYCSSSEFTRIPIDGDNEIIFGDLHTLVISNPVEQNGRLWFLSKDFETGIIYLQEYDDLTKSLNMTELMHLNEQAQISTKYLEMSKYIRLIISDDQNSFSFNLGKELYIFSCITKELLKKKRFAGMPYVRSFNGTKFMMVVMSSPNQEIIKSVKNEFDNENVEDELISLWTHEAWWKSILFWGEVPNDKLIMENIPY